MQWCHPVQRGVVRVFTVLFPVLSCVCTRTEPGQAQITPAALERVATLVSTRFYVFLGMFC